MREKAKWPKPPTSLREIWGWVALVGIAEAAGYAVAARVFASEGPWAWVVLAGTLTLFIRAERYAILPLAFALIATMAVAAAAHMLEWDLRIGENMNKYLAVGYFMGCVLMGCLLSLFKKARDTP